MGTGHPDTAASRLASEERLTSIVGRVALAVSLVVLVTLPVAYAGIAYRYLVDKLALEAKVKATALSTMVTASPDLWMFQEHRIAEFLMKHPIPLEKNELAGIFNLEGRLIASAGEAPARPFTSRSAALHDSGRQVARVEVSASLLPVIGGTAVATLVGMLLAAAVFFALRVVPLRALRRVTDALFEQRESAQVTLHSIADAVITTDRNERVQYLNPAAQKLTGWNLGESTGVQLAEVLSLFDAETGSPLASPLRPALADDLLVSQAGAVDLVRRDAGRSAVESSAAPIHGPSGAIIGGVVVFRDVSAARKLTQRSSWEAAHDALTGLVNRREFEQRLETALIGTRNAGNHHVVCYMDLDQFKVVNDTCGHAAGDSLLKELAGLLQSRVRASDTLARLGGDEFGLLLDGCSLERAQFIAADILAAVRDFRFHSDGKVFTVGVSIGLATTSNGSSGAEVMSMADTACYWAKEQGRDRVCTYRAGDSDMAVRRREMGWIARINSALAENRLILYHQSYLPLNAAAGTRQHLEVLLRMIDEEGGLVLPGSFLPAAERYNLMPAIDRWVVNAVFAGYHALVAQRRGAPLTCAINLSGTTLNAEGFLDFIKALALKHALPTHSICFEITETAAINNLRKAAEFIQECRSLGFLFALDDFGTGTSSFGYLKNLPVDYLKIDGGFVKNLERDPVDKAMTETINRIGHIMGIKTVAEFAENDTIIQELKTMGVDYAQGFGVCVPTPLFAERLSGPSLAHRPAAAAAPGTGGMARTAYTTSASTRTSSERQPTG